VQGLVALVGFRAVPEPGFSWLLARLVTLLEGRQPAVSSSIVNPCVISYFCIHMILSNT
jgi:hypothetical protein